MDRTLKPATKSIPNFENVLIIVDSINRFNWNRIQSQVEAGLVYRYVQDRMVNLIDTFVAHY